MADARRIPIPWTQRWRWIRFQALPILIFAGCAVAMIWAWDRRGQTATITGEVFATRVEIASLSDGVLIDLPGERRIELFQEVRKGELIALLDGTPLELSIARLRSEVAMLEGELVKAAEEERLNQIDRDLKSSTESRRLAEQIESLRLTIIDRRALMETARIELKSNQEQVKALKELLEKKVVTRVDLLKEEALTGVYQEKMKGAEVGLKEARQQLAESMLRMQQMKTESGVDTDKFLAPIKGELAAKKAEILEYEAQINNLEIHAPIAGKIAAIACWPGQAVKAGDPIVTVAADRGEYILSYVRPRSAMQPTVGMAVDVQIRNPRHVIASQVRHIGPQIELVPPHQLLDPRVEEWGLPIRIAVPPTAQLRPGELVDVKFLSLPNGPTPARSAQPDPPPPMNTPPDA